MYAAAKRGVDIIVSAVGLIFLGICLPFITLAVKLDSPGPVFFRARRVSAGRVITIFKFRTMRASAETEKSSLLHLNERRGSPFFKISRDPRVTRVGRVLRQYWLDELPQLWNVLRGDISLVGPRPYEPEEIASYPPAYQFLRYEKAGITGLSQINGSWNLSYAKVLEYDAYYARHKSLRLDLKIIAKTALLLRHPSGV